MEEQSKGGINGDSFTPLEWFEAIKKEIKSKKDIWHGSDLNREKAINAIERFRVQFDEQVATISSPEECLEKLEYIMAAMRETPDLKVIQDSVELTRKEIDETRQFLASLKEKSEIKNKNGVGSWEEREIHRGIKKDLNHAQLKGQSALILETSPMGIQLENSKGDLNSKANLENLEKSASSEELHKHPQDMNTPPCNKGSSYAEIVTNSQEQATQDNNHATSHIAIPYFPSNLNKQLIKFPKDTLKKGAEIWLNCIVGKFTARRPPSQMIRAKMTALWKKRGLISIMEQGDIFTFKFDTDENKTLVLENRVWRVAGQQMIISDWLEENAYAASHFTKFPIWVKLYNVPAICWTKDGIGELASVIGKPLTIDKITETRSHMNFAKVKVEVEAGIPRPKEIKVEIAENLVHEVKIGYTGCPPSCTKCKVFGHFLSHCPMRVKSTETQKQAEERVANVEKVTIETSSDESSDEEESTASDSDSDEKEEEDKEEEIEKKKENKTRSNSRWKGVKK